MTGFRAALVLIAWLLATPLAAQTFPALYDVTGVQSNDTLNVRAAPSAQATILDELPPFASGIEVTGISDTGRWLRINSREGAAWVSARYMARQPGQDTVIGRPLACFGTEPFWALSITGSGPVVLEAPASGPRPFTFSGWTASANRSDHSLITAENIPDLLSGVISATDCNDGMSDQLFGLTLDLVIEDARGANLLSGCCSLLAN